MAEDERAADDDGAGALEEDAAADEERPAEDAGVAALDGAVNDEATSEDDDGAIVGPLDAGPSAELLGGPSAEVLADAPDELGNSVADEAPWEAEAPTEEADVPEVPADDAPGRDDPGIMLLAGGLLLEPSVPPLDAPSPLEEPEPPVVTVTVGQPRAVERRASTGRIRSLMGTLRVTGGAAHCRFQTEPCA